MLKQKLAFGKLSRRMNFNVIGLPHYVIWHIYEPSKEDLKHMAWMAEEEKRKLEETRLLELYDKIWEIGFDDVREDWTSERDAILKNIDLTGENGKKIEVDWSDDPEDNQAPNAQLAQNENMESTENPQGDIGRAKYPKEVPLEFDPDKN